MSAAVHRTRKLQNLNVVLHCLVSKRAKSGSGVHGGNRNRYARAVPEVQGDEIFKFGEWKMWWIFGGKFSVNFSQEK